jgi:hypothetical protein
MSVTTPTLRERATVRSRATSFTNPLKRGGTIVATAIGEAEGSRGAAAALACAEVNADAAALLVDIGGRAPRPTLIASAPSQKLEERLASQLPQGRVAARGQICHLALPADVEGLEAAAAALRVARDGRRVVHLPPQLLQPALLVFGSEVSAGLLRADLPSDRALVALVARTLIERGIAVGVLKRRLNWVAERRALFGVLPAGSPGGLPERLLRRLSEAAG